MSDFVVIVTLGPKASWDFWVYKLSYVEFKEQKTIKGKERERDKVKKQTLNYGEQTNGYKKGGG